MGRAKLLSPTPTLMPSYLPRFMGKRLTETSKWTQPWYRRLSPTAKNLHTWLNDNCDHAGVIDPDLELATFQIGEPIEEKHVAEFGERIQSLPDGKLWLRDFIPTQYGQTLSLESSAHRAVIKLIQTHSLEYPIPHNTHKQPIPDPCQTHTVPLTKGTEHGHGHEEGGTGETNSHVVNQSFVALQVANRICANTDGWSYDNCKVAVGQLKANSLRSLIEPFTGQLKEKQIVAAWQRAVFKAHGAKVDRLAKNATAYAVQCFKNELEQLCQEKGKK